MIDLEPIYPFFQWAEQSWLGSLVAQSIWAFAVIESIHLVGLCLLGGAILVVDLRMLGLGLKEQPIHQLRGYARPWLNAALAIMVLTGVPLFMSEAIKCYYNTSFWVKITTLPFALAFTYFVRERVAADESLETGWKSRLVGGASIALWFVVAAAGRWIGFS